MNIPNTLTIIRIVMVPVFIAMYFNMPAELAYVPVLILLFSGLTDIADGYIARRFNMVTQLGKFLDPVADKLTICSVVICLAIRHRILWWMVAVYAVKEVTLALIGLAKLKSWRNSIAAKWYGKASTVLLYVLMLVVLLYPAISNQMIVAFMVLPLIFIVLSFIFYLKEIDIHKNQL